MFYMPFKSESISTRIFDMKRSYVMDDHMRVHTYTIFTTYVFSTAVKYFLSKCNLPTVELPLVAETPLRCSDLLRPKSVQVEKSPHHFGYTVCRSCHDLPGKTMSHQNEIIQVV